LIKQKFFTTNIDIKSWLKLMYEQSLINFAKIVISVHKKDF